MSYVTGGQEANNLAYYMSKYTSKLPNEVTEFAPLIMKARQGARRESLMPTGNPPACPNCDNSACDGKCEAPRR